MTIKSPLKNKAMFYTRDYIESEIRWGLREDDKIFKKVDLKRAVSFLKSEIDKKSQNTGSLSIKELNLLLDESFHDVF
jgi:hypothetical protein